MKAFIQRVFVALLPVALIAIFVLFAAPGTVFSNSVKTYGLPIVGLHCLVLSFAGLLKPVRIRGRSDTVYYLWCFAVIAVFPFTFMATAFGVGDVSSILITISENRAAEMVAVGIDGFAEEFWDLLAKLVALLVLAYFVIKYVQIGQATIFALALLMIGGNPIVHHIYRSVVPHPDQVILKSDIAALAPVVEKTPETAKNVIIIYLESLERTYADVEITRDAFSKFAEFENAGLAFSNLMQIPSTFFTAGGIVATQCGVPLLPRGVFNVNRKIRDKVDVMPEEEEFLLGVECLGDLLASQGYNASYINGSSLSVFSKGAFFRSHGFQTVKGLESYPDFETEPRTNVWGMNDDLLFERLADELEILADEGQPFILSALTLATHGPDGFLDAKCAAPKRGEIAFVAAIRCSSEHVGALLQHIDDLGLTEDTLVVLLSDHIAYKNALQDQLNSVSENRRNYAVILGGKNEQIARVGSLLDVYPTILEALGYELKEHRAGLGRSLLGDTPTLIEAHGVTKLNSAIKNNSDLQRAIWASPEDSE